MSKFCQNCGKELDNEADICLNCGKDVERTKPASNNQNTNSIIKKYY